MGSWRQICQGLPGSRLARGLARVEAVARARPKSLWPLRTMVENGEDISEPGWKELMYGVLQTGMQEGRLALL